LQYTCNNSSEEAEGVNNCGDLLTLNKMQDEWPPGSSRLYGIQLVDPREGYVWLQKMHSVSRKIVILSRLSPAKLSRWINLESVDFHWITTKKDSYAIDPALERLKHFLDSLFNEGTGIIWLDAIEYLSDTHGFASTIHFIQSIGDSLMNTNWTMVMPYSPLAFKSTEVAKMRREAPNYSIDSIVNDNIMDSDNLIINIDEIDENDDGESNQISESDEIIIEIEPGLVLLSRIPEKSLSRAILQRRIEQWKDMGFDVSELGPCMLVDDRSERYNRYFSFEEKIRKATECERRIRELEKLGFTTEATKLHFRIMQLTGIDEVEKIIQDLLDEAR
tara:strand:+ start:1388 stop:2386 length:999 start_codon:yes stop_codon:yes gene_type:complete